MIVFFSVDEDELSAGGELSSKRWKLLAFQSWTAENI